MSELTTFQKRKLNPVKYQEYKEKITECVMKRYNNDPDYRQKCIENSNKNSKIRHQKKQEEHYKRWIEDPEYAEECKKKGMRFRGKNFIKG